VTKTITRIPRRGGRGTARTTADPARFLSQITASRGEEALFKGLYAEANDDERSIASLRRHRRRASNDGDGIIKTVSLVEEDGVLLWRDGIPGRANARRRGRRGPGATNAPDVEGSLVLAKEFPALKPNKVVAAIGLIDRRLNEAVADDSLRARLRSLRQKPDGSFELSAVDAAGPFSGRTLLFVHGTFSNAGNMLAEFDISGERGRRLLNRAMSGPGKYDRVLFFDHATLSVSPVMNALELGRAMAGSSGQIDVVAHSRGGLVVRWWLEAFGHSLKLAPNARVRAVLAGSPLNGTSLAAPDKIQNAMSLISNIGSFAETTLKVAGVTNPFLWVAGKLIEVIVSVSGALAKTPIVDALAALIPGLAGQSMVSNNHEINRLRLGPCVVTPAYYAIQSNFETNDPAWQFWKHFRGKNIADKVTDLVFPGRNDLVVDTSSMSDLGVKKLALAGPACDFQTSSSVWHCSYFEEDRTVNYIASQFRLVL